MVEGSGDSECYSDCNRRTVQDLSVCRGSAVAQCSMVISLIIRLSVAAVALLAECTAYSMSRNVIKPKVFRDLVVIGSGKIYTVIHVSCIGRNHFLFSCAYDMSGNVGPSGCTAA